MFAVRCYPTRRVGFRRLLLNKFSLVNSTYLIREDRYTALAMTSFLWRHGEDGGSFGGGEPVCSQVVAPIFLDFLRIDFYRIWPVAGDAGPVLQGGVMG